MHFKVFLDSNVYDSSNYSFRNGLFTQLRKYATARTLELQINSVVEGEIRRHIDQSIGDKIKELNKLIASREFAGFRKLPEYMSVLETQDKERWIKTAQDEFSSLLQDCHAERIDLNNSDVEKVFGDYFNCRYPFEDNKKKKEEFPDAFIIQSILRRIEELSQLIHNHTEEKNQWVFKDIKSTVGGLEDLRFYIVSNDKGCANLS